MCYFPDQICLDAGYRWETGLYGDDLGGVVGENDSHTPGLGVFWYSCGSNYWIVEVSADGTE